MLTQLALSQTNSRTLRVLQGSSSAAVGKMIGLVERLQEYDMDALCQKVQDALPVECNTNERLAMSYAMDLACSYTVCIQIRGPY